MKREIEGGAESPIKGLNALLSYLLKKNVFEE
jgi:hypothetical protein